MATTLPYRAYVDQELLDREQDDLFSTSWHYVANDNDFDHDIHSLPTNVGRLPVVITKDEQIRAFVNVCAHRGSIVCKEASTRESMTCPYHAWRYSLDGSLISAPRSERERGFETGDHSLEELAVGRWGPFVFVNPSANAAPFEDFIGDLPDQVEAAGIDVDHLVFHSRVRFELAANWKICAENFLECYHCRVAHPNFAKAIDTSPDEYLLSASDTFSTQQGPPRSNGVIDLGGEIERAQFHLLYPNTAINIMAGRPNLSIGPITPIEPNRTSRFLDYYFGPDVEDDWIDSMLTFDNQVGDEDRVLVEDMQRGMTARPARVGSLFMDSEHLIDHFETYVRRHVSYEL